MRKLLPLLSLSHNITNKTVGNFNQLCTRGRLGGRYRGIKASKYIMRPNLTKKPDQGKPMSPFSTFCLGTSILLVYIGAVRVVYNYCNMDECEYK